jgi:hypothetical protein
LRGEFVRWHGVRIRHQALGPDDGRFEFFLNDVERAQGVIACGLFGVFRQSFDFVDGDLLRLLLLQEAALTFEFLMDEVIKPDNRVHPLRPLGGFGHCSAGDFIHDIGRLERVRRNLAREFVVTNVPARMTQ